MTMTPIEEVRAYNRELLAAASQKEGFEGAVSRLLLIVSPDKVTDWLHAELERGTNHNELAGAFAAGLGAVMLPVVSAAANPKIAAADVLARLAKLMLEALSGNLQLEGVRLNPDGTQERITMAGIMKEAGR